MATHDGESKAHASSITDVDVTSGNAAALIITDAFLCPCHGPVVEPSVQIVRVDAQPAGWVSFGRVPESTARQCPRCGMVAQVINDAVPVELAEYACPHCGTGQHLVYKVLRVQREAKGYVFIAEAVCKNCTRVSLLNRMLRGLGKIRKIKVGPTGVEIERETTS